MSLPGEPAPELVRKQKLLQNLHEEVKPGKLKAFIKERIGTLGEQIKENLKSDEEFLTHRG
ncbi:hypothetical protein C5S32_09800 [ANME-1 cluster archaeon GoMg1]|nr:hypothetical protein [ANME-1 cluster archaeon GoMg1]